jgi:hypothetical protein
VEQNEVKLNEIKATQAENSASAALPPYFGKNFRETGLDWVTIGPVNFDVIGKVLSYHLILEHYLEKFLEIATPSYLKWEKAGLTFGQKVSLVGSEKGPLKFMSLREGIAAVNKIRNGFSHNLESKFNPEHISVLKKCLVANNKARQKEMDRLDDLKILETFTYVACSFFAGWCSSSVAVSNMEKRKRAEALKSKQQSKNPTSSEEINDQ